MEDFFEGGHGIVGAAGHGLEKGGHLGLPSGVDGVTLHAVASSFEVFGFEVANEEAVGAEEERVILPAGLPEGFEHLGPDGGVAGAVLFEAVGADFQEEADALHGWTTFPTRR